MPEEGWQRDRRPVRSVVRNESGGRLSPERWPGDIPAVAQLLQDGLKLPAGVTFLVGENGSGKSTIVAALPGRATILEVGEWGLRESAWEDLVLVQNWRSYLSGPDRYLRHVIE